MSLNGASSLDLLSYTQIQGLRLRGTVGFDLFNYKFFIGILLGFNVVSCKGGKTQSDH